MKLGIILVLAASVMAQEEEANSPSEFPYHSFMCDDLELQEFIDEQVMRPINLHISIIFL